MSKHKALELADWLDNCEPNFYGESSSRMDDKLAGAVADLTDAARAQHALIVQMREELADLKSRMQPNVNGADETYFFIGLKRQISVSRMEQLTAALAAADKYLGEQG